MYELESGTKRGGKITVRISCPFLHSLKKRGGRGLHYLLRWHSVSDCSIISWPFSNWKAFSGGWWWTLQLESSLGENPFPRTTHCGWHCGWSATLPLSVLSPRHWAKAQEGVSEGRQPIPPWPLGGRITWAPFSGPYPLSASLEPGLVCAMSLGLDDTVR